MDPQCVDLHGCGWDGDHTQLLLALDAQGRAVAEDLVEELGHS